MSNENKDAGIQVSLPKAGVTVEVPKIETPKADASLLSNNESAAVMSKKTVEAESNTEQGIKINLGGNEMLEKGTIKNEGLVNDLLNMEETATVDFVIPKAKLVECLKKHLPVQRAEVEYVKQNFLEFSHFVKTPSTAITGGNLSAEEELGILKLFYPNADPMSPQAIEGFLTITMKAEELGDIKALSENSIFTRSSMINPEKLFVSQEMSKFTLKNQRNLFKNGLSNNTITYYIPTVLVALTHLGIDAEKAISNNFISVGEAGEMVTIHIRKDM